MRIFVPRLAPLALLALASCTSGPAPRAQRQLSGEPAQAVPAPGASAAPAPASGAKATPAEEWRALQARLENESKAVTSAEQAQAFLARAEAAFADFAASHAGTEEARKARVGIAEIAAVRGDSSTIAKLEAVAAESTADEAGQKALEMLVVQRAEGGDIPAAKAALARLEAAHKDDPSLEPLRSLIAEEEKKPQVGAAAPALSARASDGNDVTLADMKGKVVLIDFWATWCGPCRAELPHVLDVYHRFHEKGLEIIGVSLDEDEQKLKDFVAEKKIPWPQNFDGQGWSNAVAKAWGIHSIPATFVIGRDGVVRTRDVRGDALARAVEDALAAN
jgi:peroxiredoxin